MSQLHTKRRFAVILAGGEGSRLKSLTRAITGDERPKQFCPILEGETLLEGTRKRVSMLIEDEKIFYVVTQKHRRFYETELRKVPWQRVLVQAKNKGTAPAILYSLLRIGAMDPEATIAFFPSDHYFSNDSAFIKRVETAYAAAENCDDLILLGIEPDRRETSYGWIETEESIFGSEPGAASRVKRFWEKPTSEVAMQLMQKSSLWNTFVMVGKVKNFSRLIQEYLPELYRIFSTTTRFLGGRDEYRVMTSVYASISETNFSTEVLQKCSFELLVIRVSDVWWSDLGEPERVLGTLFSLGLEPEWLAIAC